MKARIPAIHGLTSRYLKIIHRKDRKMERKKAFPHDIGGVCGQSTGMDLRDYFAAAALTGLVMQENEDCIYKSIELTNMAYQIADAMMNERGT